MADEVRLQKFMADCGVASRRACEELIASGRVKVNGRKVTMQGVKIDPINTQVEVDGQTISAIKTKTYIAFHKPKGVLSTMFDPEGRPCLGDYFGGFSERLFHAGRLDKESEGLTSSQMMEHGATSQLIHLLGLKKLIWCKPMNRFRRGYFRHYKLESNWTMV